VKSDGVLQNQTASRGDALMLMGRGANSVSGLKPTLKKD